MIRSEQAALRMSCTIFSRVQLTRQCPGVDLGSFVCCKRKFCPTKRVVRPKLEERPLGSRQSSWPRRHCCLEHCQLSTSFYWKVRLSVDEAGADCDESPDFPGQGYSKPCENLIFPSWVVISRLIIEVLILCSMCSHSEVLCSKISIRERVWNCVFCDV